MIKAIIFDFDGVLVESCDIKTGAFAKLFKGEGDDAVREVVRYHLDHGGVSRFEKFKYIYEKILARKLTKTVFDELCAKFSKLVIEDIVKTPYVKGAKGFLNAHAAHYRCFVISATPQSELDQIVRKRRMQHYFVRLYGAPKAKVGCVRDITRKYDLMANEVVYVGDALSDYEAAVENGIHFIARIDENESTFYGIDCVKVKDLTNLSRILESMDKGSR